MTKVNNKWEKEFNKEFLDDPYEKGIVYSTGVSIKDFISKTLQQQREEIIEKIKSLPQINFDNQVNGEGKETYDEVISDVLEILER